MKYTNKRGTCPVCKGTAQVDNKECPNCGGQHQFGFATGDVYLNAQGEPCVHEYKSWTTKKNLTVFRCIHCLETFSYDSNN